MCYFILNIEAVQIVKKKNPVVYFNNLREYRGQATVRTLLISPGLFTNITEVIFFCLTNFDFLFMELRNVLDLKSGRYKGFVSV